MTEKKNFPVVLIGGGGHAKVLLDVLLTEGVKIWGILDKSPPAGELYGIPIIGDDDDIGEFAPSEVILVNGLGSTDIPGLRRRIYETFTSQGYKFRCVLHRSAQISRRAILDDGVQIMAGAVVNIGSRIGKNSIINTGATIDHDCRIGEHTHIAPGCTISGGVTVGNNTHIGTGTTIIQKINIGNNVLIGAGSLILNDVPDNVVVYGVPAKIRRKIS